MLPWPNSERLTWFPDKLDLISVIEELDPVRTVVPSIYMAFSSMIMHLLISWVGLVNDFDH